MKRKIYNSLLDWKKNDASRTALLIDGARRVGKSYIVNEFARNEYKTHILIDFNRVSVEKVLQQILPATAPAFLNPFSGHHEKG